MEDAIAKNPFSLYGKTILVTGASSGIGRATAVLCSIMGAKVVITGRNEERLLETYNSLIGEGHLYYLCDLINVTERNTLVLKLPKLDGIVHCAGIGHRKLGKDLKAEDISAVMQVNFSATVLLQAEILNTKKINKDASIVFLSSRTTEIPTIANSLYSASKGAIQSYAKCLTLEVAPRGIRVNCICPAMVWTPLILDEGVTEDALKEQEKKYPLKRYGTPEDVANLAVFLLSDGASWITGSCFDITGGSIEI